MEKLLRALTDPEDTKSHKELLAAKAKTLVGYCRNHLPIHRSASSLAVDVIEDTLREVFQDLMSNDPDFKTEERRRTDDSR